MSNSPKSIFQPVCRFLCMAIAVSLGAPNAYAQEEYPGEADLNEAVDLQMVADTDREFDEIADLCESAIEKGLDARGEELAKQIWSSTLLAHAQNHAEKIFNGEYRTRWQIYRTRALTRLEKAVELDPDLAEAHELIARLNLELPNGDQQMARDAVDRMVESSGDSAGKANALILRARLAEDNSEAIGFLSKAIEADPNNTTALQLRGGFYLQEEDYEKAAADFVKIGELEPDNIAGFPAAAETLIQAEKYDEALQYADKILEHDQTDTKGYLLRSEIFEAQDQHDEAIAAIDNAVEIDDADANLFLRRASLYYDQENYEKALEDVNRTLDLEPAEWRGIYLKSFVKLALEEYDEAIAEMSRLRDAYRRMYAVEPDALEEYLRFSNDYAMMHAAAKRSPEAIEIYNDVLREEPENARALRGRADAYLSTGDHARAIEDYKAAMDLTPDDDGILNNYAWVLATSPDDDLRDGELAMELAKKAHDLTEGKQAHILSTLAAAYAENGDFEAAREWATRAVEAAEDEEQRKGLQEELESYQKDPPQPWRERETEGQEKESDDDTSSEKKESDDDDSSGGNDDNDSSDGDGSAQAVRR